MESDIKMESFDGGFSANEKIDLYNNLKEQLNTQRLVNEAYESMPAWLVDQFRQDEDMKVMIDKAEEKYYENLEKEKKRFEAQRKKLAKRSFIHMSPEEYMGWAEKEYSTLGDKDKHVVFIIERIMPYIYVMASHFRDAFFAACRVRHAYRTIRSDKANQSLLLDIKNMPDVKELCLKAGYIDHVSILLHENVEKYKDGKEHKEIMETIFAPFIYTSLETLKDLVMEKKKRRTVVSLVPVPEDKVKEMGRFTVELVTIKEGNKHIAVEQREQGIFIDSVDIPSIEFFEFYIGERIEKLIAKHVEKLKSNLSEYGKQN